jgi:hypothetical protein
MGHLEELLLTFTLSCVTPSFIPLHLHVLDLASTRLLSPNKHIPHKPMIILEVTHEPTNTSLQSSFAYWRSKIVYLLCKHYLPIAYEVLHPKISYLVGALLPECLSKGK